MHKRQAYTIEAGEQQYQGSQAWSLSELGPRIGVASLFQTYKLNSVSAIFCLNDTSASVPPVKTLRATPT